MSWKRFITDFSQNSWALFSALFHFLLPSSCILCAQNTGSSANLCSACKHELPILSHSCFKCARRLLGDKNTALICGFCLKNSPPYDATYALFDYEKPIVQVIKALKFQHQLSHAKALGDLLIERILYDWYREKPLPDLIIPMPLHPQRMCERGFNQAIEIARPIAKKLRLPLDFLSIKRVKNTAPQTFLKADLRRKNMENAFEMSGNFHGKTVAVVDDVITTGSTITAFCSVLRAHGFLRIDVWCCARR